MMANGREVLWLGVLLCLTCRGVASADDAKSTGSTSQPVASAVNGATPEGVDAGACCVDATTCMDGVEALACTSMGGYYAGSGVLCAGVFDCDLGACCFQGGDCGDGVSATECGEFGGTHQGFNSFCKGVKCSACPGKSDCCAPDGDLGCTDADCCELVCDRMPECCSDGWDAPCVALAGDLCGALCGTECGTAIAAPEGGVGGSGDCCAVHPTTGCIDGTCCQTVCSVNPFCCDVTWDEVCVGLANTLCDPGGNFCGVCPGEGDCCLLNDTPGCSDTDCCQTVCGANPACCGGEWTQDCADTAAALCGTEGVAVPFCSGACCTDATTCNESVPISFCSANGGVYRGTGVLCADVPDCDTGSCCFAGGACSDAISFTDCMGAGGMYQGFGSECVSVTCPLCPGASDCCAPDGLLGCNDASCCNQVCSLIPECCTEGWSLTCVDMAVSLCGALCDSGCPSPGDFENDGDVDLVDFGSFQLCYSGGGAPAAPGCECGDFDSDGDVDLVDFGNFQLAFTG